LWNLIIKCLFPVPFSSLGSIISLIILLPWTSRFPAYTQLSFDLRLEFKSPEGEIENFSPIDMEALSITVKERAKISSFFRTEAELLAKVVMVSFVFGFLKSGKSVEGMSEVRQHCLGNTQSFRRPNIFIFRMVSI